MRFWRSKFDETVDRDKRNVEALRKLGWKVAVVWECSIKDKGADVVADSVATWLRSGKPYKEISGSKGHRGRRR
jgi:DNA mismatch endonuclease (patch repair protein)